MNWTVQVVSRLKSEFLENTGGRWALSQNRPPLMFPPAEVFKAAGWGTQCQAIPLKVPIHVMAAGLYFKLSDFVHGHGLRSTNEASVSHAIKRNMVCSTCP